MTKVTISRRAALVGAAALPAVAAVGSGLAQAAAPLVGAAQTPFARFKLGSFEVTTLLDGSRTVPEPQNIFGMNVGADEFAQASQNAFIPADKAKFFFTPTLINTGTELVLFDTGLGGDNGNLEAAMAQAGYRMDQVDIVVITHMHPDHIGGLMVKGDPAFPNARYVTGEVEYNFWTTKGAENRVGQMVAKLVTPQAEKMSFVKDGDAVVSGITAVEAYGHTPGHMCYMVESDGQQLMLIADATNHYVWSLAYPDWEVKFDGDKAAAAATRRKLLGMLATDRIPFIGYHMPFPALGYVETRDKGFHYVPASYQLLL